jgi:hypothetical protein|tara:strand:+ start:859 stop:1017 length:159 start_codon:yes stop_codon:yes gene_type:complete
MYQIRFVEVGKYNQQVAAFNRRQEAFDYCAYLHEQLPEELRKSTYYYVRKVS